MNYLWPLYQPVVSSAFTISARSVIFSILAVALCEESLGALIDNDCCTRVLNIKKEQLIIDISHPVNLDYETKKSESKMAPKYELTPPQDGRQTLINTNMRSDEEKYSDLKLRELSYVINISQHRQATEYELVQAGKYNYILTQNVTPKDETQRNMQILYPKIDSIFTYNTPPLEVRIDNGRYNIAIATYTPVKVAFSSLSPDCLFCDKTLRKYCGCSFAFFDDFFGDSSEVKTGRNIFLTSPRSNYKIFLNDNIQIFRMNDDAISELAEKSSEPRSRFCCKEEVKGYETAKYAIAEKKRREYVKYWLERRKGEITPSLEINILALSKAIEAEKIEKAKIILSQLVTSNISHLRKIFEEGAIDEAKEILLWFAAANISSLQQSLDSGEIERIKEEMKKLQDAIEKNKKNPMIGLEKIQEKWMELYNLQPKILARDCLLFLFDASKDLANRKSIISDQFKTILKAMNLININISDPTRYDDYEEYLDQLDSKQLDKETRVAYEVWYKDAVEYFKSIMNDTLKKRVEEAAPSLTEELRQAVKCMYEVLSSYDYDLGRENDNFHKSLTLCSFIQYLNSEAYLEYGEVIESTIGLWGDMLEKHEKMTSKKG